MTWKLKYNCIILSSFFSFYHLLWFPLLSLEFMASFSLIATITYMRIYHKYVNTAFSAHSVFLQVYDFRNDYLVLDKQ